MLETDFGTCNLFATENAVYGGCCGKSRYRKEQRHGRCDQCHLVRMCLSGPGWMKTREAPTRVLSCGVSTVRYLATGQLICTHVF